MIHTIQQSHSYRARLIPAGVPAEDIAHMAAMGELPTIRVRAADAEHAAVAAQRVSGQAVHEVERVEG